MILLELLWRFVLIGAVAFGGGYAMLPVFERVMVSEQGWLSPTLFVDMIAISQMTPGPIAINAATFIGYQTTVEVGFLTGVLGSLVATLGVVLVPIILVLTVASHKEGFERSQTFRKVIRSLRPVLLGLVGASLWSIGRATLIDVTSLALFGICVLLLLRFKWHPLMIIGLSGVLGFIFF